MPTPGLMRLRNFGAGALADLEKAVTSERRLSSADLHQLRVDLVDWLGTLIQEQSLLTAVANQSYRHDNGFLKLVIDSVDGVAAELRLHLWGAMPTDLSMKTGDNSSNIHNHCADFASVVLMGEMLEETFSQLRTSSAVDGGFIEYDCFECSPRLQAGHYAMSHFGRATLRRDTSARLRSGDLHALRHSVLHRITSKTMPTMTYFVQGPRRTYGTMVYSTSGRVSAGQVDSPPLKPDDTRHEIVHVLSMLEQGLAP